MIFDTEPGEKSMKLIRKVTAKPSALTGFSALIALSGWLAGMPLPSLAQPSNQPNTAQEVQKEIRYMSIPTDTEQVTSLVLPPDSQDTLLRNIKYAIEHNLFVAADFFTEDSLKTFCASNRARSFTFNDSTQPSQDILLSGVAIQENSNASKRISRETGKISVELSVYTLDITPDRLIELFGKPHEIKNPYVYTYTKPSNEDHPPHGWIVWPKTHPFGNHKFVYHFETEQTRTTLSIMLQPNGYVSSFDIKQTER